MKTNGYDWLKGIDDEILSAGFVVYVFTNLVNGKQYVGKTCQIFRRRLRYHINAVLNGDMRQAIHRAILKYGWDNFTVSLSFIGLDNEALCAAETSLIRDLNSFGNHGYNMTRGGEGVPMRRPDITKRLKGKKMPPEFGAKVSAAKRAAPISNKQRAQTARIVAYAKAHVSKPVWCPDTGEVWESKLICAKAHGHKNTSHLNRCINSNERLFCGKRMRDMDGSTKPVFYAPIVNPVWCLETGKFWINHRQCVRELGGNNYTSSLAIAVDKPNRTFKGFHFVSHVG